MVSIAFFYKLLVLPNVLECWVVDCIVLGRSEVEREMLYIWHKLQCWETLEKPI